LTSKANIDDILLSPDKLYIDKKLILRVLNAIEKHWTRNADSRMANMQYGIYMEAIKTSIHLTKEEVLSNIWTSIMLALNEVMRLNAFEMSMKNKKDGFSGVEKLYDIAISKLESGELFKDVNIQKN
jgi:hypothetical protein